jgi:hypothetical protein
MTAKRKSDTKATTTDDAAEPEVPWGLLVVAWLVPGLGHWILGKKVRAAVFAAVIVAAFLTGLVLDGELGVMKPNSPFSWMGTLACLGNGVLYFIRLVSINGFGDAITGWPFGLDGGGNPMSAGYAYGKTFLVTAGLMNLLTVLDASDIARGAKD